MSDGGLLSLGDGALPARLATLIGRDAEVAELARLVDQERLLTLVGAPGCGKTRLAIEVAARLEPCRPGDHYLDLAERCAVLGSRTPQQAAQPIRLDHLARDDGNLLAALEWANRQPGDLALRLGTALVEHFLQTGRVNDGRRWLRDALAKGTDDQHLHTRALAGAGSLAWRQGSYDRARSKHEQAVAIAVSIGDSLLQATSLHGLAFAEFAAGNIAAALDHGREALDIARANDDGRTIAGASLPLGWANYSQGDAAAGDEHMRTGLEANRHIGDPFVTGHAHLGSGFGACLAGDAEAQRTHLLAALAAMDGGANVARTNWLWGGVTLAAQEGRSHATLRLMGAVGAMEWNEGGAQAPTELAQQFVPLVTRAVKDVSPALVDQLLEHGRQLQWDELVAEALAKPGAGPESTLTRREHEIAGLVAQGLTNVQIADGLVISRRTVESHIGHIRQKLGVSSRNKIIVWVLQESSSARGS